MEEQELRRCRSRIRSRSGSGSGSGRTSRNRSINRGRSRRNNRSRSRSTMNHRPIGLCSQTKHNGGMTWPIRKTAPSLIPDEGKEDRI